MINFKIYSDLNGLEKSPDTDIFLNKNKIFKK